MNNIYLVSNSTFLYTSSLYIIINLDEGIELLKPLKEIALDTETSGLDCFSKKLLLLQLGNYDFQVLFDIESFNYKIPKELVNFLNENRLYIIQNSKFDLKFLFTQGIIIKNVFDTMLAEIILTNGLQYDGRDLKTIVQKYCQITLNKEIRGQIIKKGLNDSVLVYGANDIKYLNIVKEKQLKEASILNLKTAIDLDNSFVVVLAYIEYCGIKLDLEKWLKLTEKYKETASILKNKLETILYKDFRTKYFSGSKDLFTGEDECLINWDSPKQVIKVFKDYGINVKTWSKGEEKESIDAKVLEPQKNKFEIIPAYLEYKEIMKLISTYGDNWKNYINPVTGRIHTTYRQLVDTGRLSSGNKDENCPNMQNLPSDEETRSCFISEFGHMMCSCDFKSQEQVVLANFSKEKNLLNFYERGFDDMHSYVAFLMYPNIRKYTVEELSPDKLKYIKKEYPSYRVKAKSAGFAINYGGNGDTIAKNCNISKDEGKFVYESYFNSFPGLKNYFDWCFYKATKFGYIQFNDVTKRKYFLSPLNDYFTLRDKIKEKLFWATEPNAKDLFKKYNKAKGEIARISQNFPIQGSSADITKYSCILFFKELLKRDWWLKVKIVNIVHDEIIIEAPKNIIKEASEILVSCMRKSGDPFCKIIPLDASSDIGTFWIH